jgi:hypothetical protein
VIQLPHHRWKPPGTLLLWTGPPILFVALVFCSELFGWKWTGLNNRTLRDWMKLLLAAAVPAVIGYLGARISKLQYLGQRAAEEQRAQDLALQAYIDQMGQLLLDKERPLRSALAPV